MLSFLYSSTFPEFVFNGLKKAAASPVAMFLALLSPLLLAPSLVLGVEPQLLGNHPFFGHIGYCQLASQILPSQVPGPTC